MQVTLPDNLVLVGEAVASFNPVYGQGMTVSILEAMELDKLLTECRPVENLSGLSQVIPVRSESGCKYCRALIVVYGRHYLSR